MYPGNYGNNHNPNQNYFNSSPSSVGYHHSQQTYSPNPAVNNTYGISPSPSGIQVSACNGRKKALLIGINYFRQKAELKGCINDVRNMRSFLISRWGFLPDGNSMVILTDDQMDVNFIPTKTNIINAMKWLVGGAVRGDSLFFHFSGHGGQVKDRDGDECDGYDSCIYPVDFQRSGPILDDLMHELMVKFLPTGVRLTAVLDCCHSGTGLDLPYVYNSDGTLKKYNPAKLLISNLKSSSGKLVRDPVGAALSLVGGVLNAVTNFNSNAEERSRQTRTSYADVIMFSGCKDEQTSADTFVGGVGATGAMSYALMKALNENPQQTYLSLLNHVRYILYEKYNQKPQLSSGRPMDMNAYFYM